MTKEHNWYWSDSIRKLITSNSTKFAEECSAEGTTLYIGKESEHQFQSNGVILSTKPQIAGKEMYSDVYFYDYAILTEAPKEFDATMGKLLSYQGNPSDRVVIEAIESQGHFPEMEAKYGNSSIASLKMGKSIYSWVKGNDSNIRTTNSHLAQGKYVFKVHRFAFGVKSECDVLDTVDHLGYPREDVSSHRVVMQGITNLGSYDYELIISRQNGKSKAKHNQTNTNDGEIEMELDI